MTNLSPQTMTTITTEQQQAIADVLATMTLPKGIGTAENACSIAAINLALTGELTDRIPPCMSEVIGKWIIGAQDAMPAELRNSQEWKRLLPLAAGTGRQREDVRLAIIMDWMWGTVLPTIQPIADRAGYGDKWRTMLRERTVAAASDARDASSRASYAASYASDAADAAADASYAASYVADASDAASYVAAASRAASYAASYASDAADASYAASYASASYAYADAAVAVASYSAATYASDASSWQQFNPCGLLQTLIAA